MLIGAFNTPESLKIIGNPNVDWSNCKESFENYLRASGLEGVSDKRKIAILVNLIGEDATEVKNTSTFDKEEDKDKYDIILSKFEDYFVPKNNLTVERFNFFKLKQEIGEPFESFLLKLRSRARSCEWGNLKDSLITTQIILGVNNEETRR